MDSEAARSEKLAKLIDIIRSKKADREAAREAVKEDKTPKQSHETEGDHFNKRNTDEHKPAETIPNTLDQGQSVNQEDKSTSESKAIGSKDAPGIPDIQSSKTIIGKKPTASSVVQEKTLEVGSIKHEPIAPTGDHSSQNNTPSKEKGPVAQKNDKTLKSEVNGTNGKEFSQQQSGESSTQNENAQNIIPGSKQNGDSNKVDHFDSKPKSEKNKMEDNKTQEGEPKKERPKKEEPKKEEPKKEEPKKHEPKEEKSTESHTFNQSESSQQPNPVPSNVAQEKKIPYYPHQQNSIDEIRTQVDGIETETEDLNFSKENVPETNTAAFFEGYGIAAGHAEDEFGGLGLIGVFEDVTSAANKSTCQQLYFFTFLFLITWYLFNMNHRH